MKNITLSAEERLIAAARTRALQENTTLNQAFRDWLARYAARDAASGKHAAILRQLSHVSAGRHFTREEMNER